MRVEQERNSAVSLEVLEVTVQWGEDGDIVSLAGEFDIAGTSRVSAVIKALLTSGRRQILVDLEAVTFMDGSAIGALISAHERMRQVGGSLEVTPNPLCLRLLHVTGELNRLSFRKSELTGGDHHPVGPTSQPAGTTASQGYTS